MKKNWYLVFCKPRGETLAQRNLERQGFVTYLPLVRQTRRRFGKRATRIEPLFPRYLFILLDTVTDNWAPIRSTTGVTSLVRFGMEPAVVPDALIELLKRREDEHGIQDLAPPQWQAGDRVQITEGPFMGYAGIFLAKTSRERVIVLLDIVGRRTRVKIDAGHLEGPD